MRISQGLAALAAVFLLGSAVSAQTPPEQTPPPTATVAAPASQSPAAESGSQGQSMQRMSDSVTKMSEMCQMMMKKEMTAMPYKIAAGITIGVLLFVALVLFVILEVQWIIYWSRLLKKRDDSLGS